jgi:hypothetical protein
MIDLKTLQHEAKLIGLPAALGFRGSHAYGTNTEQSKDIDLFYIYTLDNDHYLGLNQREESNQIFTEWNNDLYDVATFELRKWCKLINKQSPSVLEQLWTEDFLFYIGIKDLIDNRYKFLSKRIYNPFVKYALNLPDDPKSRSHSVRMLAMCYEILTEQEIYVDRWFRVNGHSQTLLDIKYGKMDPTKLIAELLAKCEIALINTQLPEEPETDLLNEICVSIIGENISKEINEC